MSLKVGLARGWQKCVRGGGQGGWGLCILTLPITSSALSSPQWSLGQGRPASCVLFFPGHRPLGGLGLPGRPWACHAAVVCSSLPHHSGSGFSSLQYRSGCFLKSCVGFFLFSFLFYSHSWYMKDGKSLSLRFLKKLLCLLTSNLAIMQSIGILVPSSLWWSFPLFQRKFLIPCSYCDNDALGWICFSIYDYWVLFWTFHLEIRLLLFWGDFFRKSCGNISAYLFSIIFFQYLQIRGWILCFNPMYPFQKLLFFPLLIKISVFCLIVWEVSSIFSSKSSTSNKFVILILIILGSAGKDS